jgi:ubiquitin
MHHPAPCVSIFAPRRGIGYTPGMEQLRRRRFAAYALPAGLVATGACAFRIEDAPIEVQEDIAAMCGRQAMHDDLMAEFQRAKIGAEEAERLGDAARCPFCGCNVFAGAANHGEQPLK